ncbi:DNA replication/repair protein RecF [Candidatus Peregrinibacteria bacterium]|nr:DNA replication/repair protein RecF [Candidatus Peregrinibacteria bacterium]
MTHRVQINLFIFFWHICKIVILTIEFKMKITKLQLENFRNYKSFSYDFPKQKNLTVLIGPNGKGKTNFLESIYILSLGKSFRTLIQEDLIEWSMDYMRCNCEIISSNETTRLDVYYSKHPKKIKKFKKNDVDLRNSEYLGNLITVLFHPENMNMLYLSPSFRRKYINILISQTDKKYLNALSNYKKILKQRNALLYEIRDKKFKGEKCGSLEEDLNAWDTKILEYGPCIISKRKELVRFLKYNIEKNYVSISGGTEEVSLEYLNPVKDNPALQKTYKTELVNRRKKDIKNAKTSIGPHLDDIKFYINSKEITTSASRGEFRTLLLSLKLAEIEYIKRETKKNPVLLLDDVFSELDRKRQSHLLKTIKNCQTIITTTDIDNLDKLAEEGASMEFVKLE